MRIAILFLILTVPALAQEVPMFPAGSGPLASPPNRYVFGQVSGFRKDQYLLDTATGRLWVIVKGKDGADELERVPFERGDAPDFSRSGTPTASPK